MHWIEYHGLEMTLVQVMAWCHQATSHEPMLTKFLMPYHMLGTNFNEIQINVCYFSLKPNAFENVCKMLAILFWHGGVCVCVWLGGGGGGGGGDMN